MTIVKDTAAQTAWHPDPGRPIEDGWGDRVANSIFQRFANIADRNTNWVDPPAGALAQTLDYMILWKWNGAAWEIVGNQPGTIIDVAVGPCPAGYLECNGQAVPAGTFLRDVLSMATTPVLNARSTVGLGAIGGANFTTLLQTHGQVGTALPSHNHGGKTDARWINHTHGMQHGHVQTGFNNDSGVFFRGSSWNGGGWDLSFQVTSVPTGAYHSPPIANGTASPNLTTEVTLSIGEQVINSDGSNAAIANYHPVMAVRKCIKV